MKAETESKFQAFGELEQARRTEKDLVLELGAGEDEFNNETEEDVDTWLCDSFLKSVFFKVIGK